MYSFNPALRILNGHIHALVALYDVARLTGSRRARRLFRLGAHDGATQLRAYDTGAWSLYSAAGAEASLSYHRLVAGFLRTSDRLPRRSGHATPRTDSDRLDDHLVHHASLRRWERIGADDPPVGDDPGGDDQVIDLRDGTARFRRPLRDR